MRGFVQAARVRWLSLVLAAALLTAVCFAAFAIGGVPFQLGQLQLNTEKGTATLNVTIPAYGKVEIVAPKTVSHTQVIGGPGELTLPIRLRQGKPVMQLRNKGRYRVRLDVFYVPQGPNQPPGGPSDLFKTVTLRLKG
jgi:hypothetical protein